MKIQIRLRIIVAKLVMKPLFWFIVVKKKGWVIMREPKVVCSCTSILQAFNNIECDNTIKYYYECHQCSKKFTLEEWTDVQFEIEKGMESEI